MNPNQPAAFKILQEAQQALKSGDKNNARQLAGQAAQLAPELEEVWLLMAALATPRDSISYLDKALEINPSSERAKKGMLWAVGRLQREVETTPEVPQPAPEPQADSSLETEKIAGIPYGEAEETEQVQPYDQPEQTPAPVVAPTVQNDKTAPRPHFSPIVLLGIVVCLVLAWAVWQGATPAAAFFTSQFTVREHGPAWAEVNIAKADAAQPTTASTPAPTTANLEPTSAPALVSPTPTPSPIPVVTLTPTGLLPTETVIPPTATNVSPTEILFPTAEFILAPTATALPFEVVITASPGSGSVEQPSPTPLPTDTEVPSASQSASVTPTPNYSADPNSTPNPNTGNTVGVAGHWIDVDLTHELVQAYNGDTVVNSFLVSTGTWQYPTVTGQYHIYVKYRYKNMTGPGYYLPNVPFTMFFYEGYALHGTYWHNNFGTPMSHGCVNLSIPDSEWIYNFASVGTLVNVHY